MINRQPSELELDIYQNIVVAANLDQKKREMLTGLPEPHLFSYLNLQELSKNRTVLVPEKSLQYRVHGVKLSVMSDEYIKTNKLENTVVIRSKDNGSCVMALVEVRYPRTRKNRHLMVSTVRKHLNEMYKLETT
jgi:hypothetical protein